MPTRRSGAQQKGADGKGPLDLQIFVFPKSMRDCFWMLFYVMRHTTLLKTANDTGVKAVNKKASQNVFSSKCAICYLLSVHWNCWCELSARSQPQHTPGAEWTKTGKVSQKKKQNKPEKNSVPNLSARSNCTQAESCINLPRSCPLDKHLPAWVSSKDLVDISVVSRSAEFMFTNEQRYRSKAFIVKYSHVIAVGIIILAVVATNKPIF